MVRMLFCHGTALEITIDHEIHNCGTPSRRSYAKWPWMHIATQPMSLHSGAPHVHRGVVETAHVTNVMKEVWVVDFSWHRAYKVSALALCDCCAWPWGQTGRKPVTFAASEYTRQ